MTPASTVTQNTPTRATAPRPSRRVPKAEPESVSTEFMILPDGTIYARNLTPELATVLATLNPHDPTMALRADSTASPSVP